VATPKPTTLHPPLSANAGKIAPILRRGERNTEIRRGRFYHCRLRLLEPRIVGEFKPNAAWFPQP